MNGFDVARKINLLNENTKIIFITGYQDAIKGKVEEEFKVAEIIEKSFDILRLLKLVKSVLGESA
jgi:DNA-binding NtrC family response regulator